MNIVVYTASFGHHDDVRFLTKRAAGVHYVAYADKPSWPSGWEMRKAPKETEGLSPKMVAKYLKTHSHLLFPDADVTLWLDANIRLTDIEFHKHVSALPEADMYLYPHTERTCIYAEAAVCIQRKLDDTSAISQQTDRYKAEGYPEGKGLWMGGILLRRNTENTSKFNEMWWSEIRGGSARDQISLPYVLGKVGVTMGEPLLIKGNWPIKRFAHHPVHTVNYTGAMSKPPEQPETDMWLKEKIESRVASGQNGWYLFASSLICPKDTVLDVGCGGGFRHGDLYAQNPRSLVGVEPAKHVRDTVHVLGSKHKLVASIPKTPAKFDVVMSMDVLEHVEDDITFLRSLLAATKRTLFITTPNRLTGPLGAHHVREYSPDELEDLIRGVCGDGCTYMFGAWAGQSMVSANYEDLGMWPTFHSRILNSRQCLAAVITVCR